MLVMFLKVDLISTRILLYAFIVVKRLNLRSIYLTILRCVTQYH